MKTSQTIIFMALSLSLLLISCGNKNKPADKESDQPQGVKATIPIEYDENGVKYIFLNTTVNDSIPLRVLFDTGWSTIAFPFSFKEMVESEDTITVQIGEWSKNYPPDWTNRDFFPQGHPFSQVMGDDLAVIGWDFFDGKIIEISFQNKYIREYAGTNSLPEGYDSLKIAKDRGMNGIPVSILVQGKKIEEYLIVDTGANGTITFNSDVAPNYAIDLTTAANRSATRVNGNTEGAVFAVDSVYLGNSLVKNHNVAFVGKNVAKTAFSGLLGTRILEKFDIILDFKNNVFYYKQLKE